MMKNIKPKLDINNLQISIIGLGKSGYSAAKLASFFNAKVHVSDNGKSKSIKIYKKELEELGVIVEGGEYSDKIYNSQLWILSPGVILPKTIILKAKSKDILIISEIEFASWFAKFPIIGVTGSNGKTTTVNLIYTICNNQNICPKLAGNVGIPFSQIVLEDLIKNPKKRLYIVEVSSFQLERVNHFRAKISIFLNISEDHLDRHKTMKNYIKTKMELIKNARQNDYIIYNYDDEILRREIKSYECIKIGFSFQEKLKNSLNVKNNFIWDSFDRKLIDLKKVLIPGNHNILNILAAINVALLLKIPTEEISAKLYTFKGVEHRIEYVANLKNVKYYNDSKATNIDSVIAAINSFESPITLILGGLDKGANFKVLRKIIKKKKISIVAYGSAAERISITLRDAANLFLTDKLKEAIEISNKVTHPGEIVLLSPGCASYDQFLNFEQRGTFFKQTVKAFATA